MSRRTVSFTQMADGTAEDYRFLAEHEAAFCQRLPERVLGYLQALESSFSGYQIDRLAHSLQAATRAERDGADDDWVVSALVHDIGDVLAPVNHSALAAAIIEPYVREECTWVVRHHGVFQLAYYGDKIGQDPEARQQWRDHPHFDSAVIFCQRWDQASFDPGYDTLPLSHFESAVGRVFARRPWQPAHLRPGVRVPLTPGSGDPT